MIAGRAAYCTKPNAGATSKKMPMLLVEGRSEGIVKSPHEVYLVDDLHTVSVYHDFPLPL